MENNRDILASPIAGLCLSLLLLVATFSGLVSCSVAPSEHDIREIMEQYYEQKNLKVVKLALGEVRSQPMGDRTYMGTSAFIVHVRSLTLLVIEDGKSPFDRQKGDSLTLKNGTVTIREDPVKKGRYVLVSISSSIVP